MKNKKCYSVWNLSKPCRNCPVVKVIESGESCEAELTPQNQDHWPETQGSWLSKAAPIRDADGSIIGAIEIAINITEHKKMENELRDSEIKYRNLFESSSEFLFTLDLKGNFTDVNKAAEVLTGYTKSELVKMNFKDYTPKRDHRKLFRAFLNIYKTGKVLHDFPVEAFMKDGSIKHFETSFSLLKKDEQIIGYQGSSKDITECKQAEEKLLASQILLNDMGKLANIGGWEFDVETEKQVWTEEIYHIHEVDMTYKPTVRKGIDFYAPASRPIIEQAIQRIIESGESFDLELEFITAKGNHLWVHSQGKADQEYGKVFGTFQDITKRKQAGEELAKYREHLEEMIKERTAELENSLKEVERMNHLFVGREFRIKELRDKIKKLENKNE